jgi:hypothetical protein
VGVYLESNAASWWRRTGRTSKSGSTRKSSRAGAAATYVFNPQFHDAGNYGAHNSAPGDVGPQSFLFFNSGI